METLYAEHTEYTPINVFKKKCPDTSIWGPQLWTIYHSLCQLPDNTKIINNNTIIDFISFSLNILPCKYCSEKTKEYIAKNKLPNSLDELEKWLWIFHNIINIENNKPNIDFLDENKIKYLNVHLKNSLHIYLSQLYLAVDLKWIDYNMWHFFRNNIIPKLELLL
jgi:hypothetical protein